MRKAIVCLGLFGYCLYSLIENQNQLIHAELKLYPLHESIRQLEEETSQLAWTIKEFESPQNLYKTVAKAEFGHLESSEITNLVARREEAIESTETIEVPKAQKALTAIGAATQHP